jgi:hypothetical protein
LYGGSRNSTSNAPRADVEDANFTASARTICKRPPVFAAGVSLQHRAPWARSTITTFAAPREAASKAQRTAAGEEIEAVTGRQILAQPVEQGLAHAVRRRPQTFRVGKAQDTPPPLATDNAYCIQDTTTSDTNRGLNHNDATSIKRNLPTLLFAADNDGHQPIDRPHAGQRPP